MIGLICIGLLGLTAVLYVTSTNEAQEAVVVPPTPTVLLPTFTSTPTPSATPTETPLPTPTGTPVISDNFGEEPPEAPGGEGGEADEDGVVEVTAIVPEEEQESTPFVVEDETAEPGVTPTNTLVLQTPTVTDTPETAPEAEMPSSGAVLAVRDRSFLSWAGIGLLVLLLVGAVRRFR